ncbi:MAG: FtsQ-type POTRA domain-containing protein [Deltaproteobacteria bacterium]|nr:FtsQ-type POTRA domain-containing protein [Deltaproteobacteria bacterium]
MNLKRLGRRGNRKTREPYENGLGRKVLFFLKNFLRASAVFSIAFSGWWLYDELIRSPYLKIQTISINGRRRLTEGEVLKLSGIYVGKNIFSVRKKEVEGSVKTHPFVEDAIVERKLPDEVRIEIVEREPVALVKLNGLFVMDKNGVLFKEYQSGDRLDLPVITVAEGIKDVWEAGVKASLLSFMEILRHQARFNLDDTSEIQVDRTYGISVVTLREGIRLEFGMGDFERKFSNLKKVVSARGGDLGGVLSVDLNNERGVVLRFSRPVVKEGGIT